MEKIIEYKRLMKLTRYGLVSGLKVIAWITVIMYLISFCINTDGGGNCFIRPIVMISQIQFIINDMEKVMASYMIASSPKRREIELNFINISCCNTLGIIYTLIVIVEILKTICITDYKEIGIMNIIIVGGVFGLLTGCHPIRIKDSDNLIFVINACLCIAIVVIMLFVACVMTVLDKNIYIPFVNNIWLSAVIGYMFVITGCGSYCLRRKRLYKNTYA